MRQSRAEVEASPVFIDAELIDVYNIGVLYTINAVLEIGELINQSTSNFKRIDVILKKNDKPTYERFLILFQFLIKFPKFEVKLIFKPISDLR